MLSKNPKTRKEIVSTLKSKGDMGKTASDVSSQKLSP